jgi:hypothetical protein
MNAILHILRKDFRHHWREAAMFVFACVAWTWQIANPSSLQFFRERELFPILLFGIWFLITVRVVQGESLLGDREFWMTRPYRWPQLMAAKAIFLVLCLNGPLLLAEIFLLLHAGLPLTVSTFGSLLFLQLEFAVFLTFPAAALAAVTESLVQWVLTILGLLLFALMLSWLPWQSLPTTLAGQENVASYLGAAIIIPALAFALFWQYARRRAWQSRLALLLAVLAVPVIIAIATTSSLRNIAYPERSGEQLPFHLSMTDKDGGHEYLQSTSSSETTIGLPLTATFSDANTILNANGYRVTLTGDNGWHWQSPWINKSIKLSADQPRTTLDFNMPYESLDPLSQVHPKATVGLAFTLYHLDPAQRILTAGNTFTLPGSIDCHWPSGRRGLFLRIASDCAASLRLPGVFEARIDSADVTCPPEQGEPPLPAGLFATYTRYGNDGPMVDFDPNPVRDPNLYFSEWVPPAPSVRRPKATRQVSFCRGTPLTIRTGHSTGQYQSWFDLGFLGQEHREPPKSLDLYRLEQDDATPEPQP